MLDIINNLKPFFEDNYRRINVREYSRIMKISPPTASKMLFEYHKQELLLIEKDRNYLFYYANRNSKIFADLSRIYWKLKLKNLVNYLNNILTSPTIILFGSLSKAETKIDSDIDLCVLSHKKDIHLAKIESNLKRKIQLSFFNSLEDIKSKELKNNIINGYILEGRLKI